MHIIKSLVFIYHNAFLIVAGLIGLSLLVGFHELGHFLLCKLFKIRTPSFSIGMGPKLLTKKIGDTEFSLSALPLGGYVEIAGLAEMGQGEQKEATSKDDRSFAVKPWYQKVLVMFGGILFNLIFAYSTLIMLFMIGIPKTEFLYPLNAKPIIAAIKKDSIAEQVGLKIGDSVTTINKVAINNDIKTLFKTVGLHQDKPLIVEVEREGKRYEFTLTSTKPIKHTIDSFGITYEIAPISSHSFGESITKGVALANLYAATIMYAFKNIFIKGDVEQVGGPIAIIKETARGASMGFQIFFLFLAIMSINLAILNLIPLPILDGGQIVFYTLEAIIRRPIPEKIREYLHIASWLLVLFILVYFSYKDIKRIFSGMKLFNK